MKGDRVAIGGHQAADKQGIVVVVGVRAWLGALPGRLSGRLAAGVERVPFLAGRRAGAEGVYCYLLTVTKGQEALKKHCISLTYRA